MEPGRPHPGQPRGHRVRGVPALEPQAHYAQASEEAIFDPQAWFTGSGSDFQARVGEVLQTAWLDKGSPESAVDGLIDRLNTALQTKPPA